MKAYQLENGRWIIANYNEQNGQYTAPMNEQERKLTGCHTYFAGRLEGLGVHSYSRKSSAVKWAKS